MRNAKMTPVRFIQKNAPYNVGEVAGFPESVAAQLVARKRAVYLGSEQESSGSVAKEPPAAEVVEAVHVGGGTYEVAGHRVKGKQAALDYAAELNARSRGETE